MKIIKWEDIDCVARVENDGLSLNFAVFEIIANDNAGELYEKKGATSSEHWTHNIDEAQTLIKGIIKWDACSHVTFGDEEGYIHLCGGRSWFVFQEVVKRIWEIAMKELPQEHSKDMFDLELFKK